MRENTIGEGGDSPRKKAQRRQMPEIGSGGEDAKDSRPKDIHAKDVAEDVPQRRTLREAELSSTPVSREAKTGEVENPRTTLEQRHPDWPKVKVTFYFSPHVTDTDTKDIGEHISGKDIYLYESTSGNRNTQTFQRLADSNPNFYSSEQFENDLATGDYEGKPLPETFQAPIMRALYGSGILVEHVDLGPDERWLANRIDQSHNYRIVPSFEETIDSVTMQLTENVKAQEEREHFITKRFEAKLAEIFETHPELKERDSIEVISSMGILHTALADKFEDNGVTTERIIVGDDTIPQARAYQEILQGREPSQDLMATSYLSNLFLRALSFAQSTSDSQTFAGRIASQFTTEEIAQIHGGMFEFGGMTAEKINRWLSSKDLPLLPQSDVDLTAALAQLKQREEERE